MSRTRNRSKRRPKSPLQPEPESEPESKPPKPEQPGSIPGTITQENQKKPKNLHADGPTRGTKVLSKDDVVLVINGMVDFIRQKSVDPITNLDHFVHFINNNYDNNTGVCSNKINCRLRKSVNNENDYVLCLEPNDVGNDNRSCNFDVSKKKTTIGDDGGFSYSDVLDCVDKKKLSLGKNDDGGCPSKGKGVSGSVSILGKNDGGGRLSEKNSKLGKNDGGVSLSEKNSSLGKNDGGVGLSKWNFITFPGEVKSSLGKNDGGLGFCSVMNWGGEKKEKSNAGEKKVNCCVVNVGGVDCMGARVNNKISVGGEKVKPRNDNGGERCIGKNGSVGEKKSKSRARGSRGRGKSRRKITSLDEKVDGGVSCSNISNCIGEKKVDDRASCSNASDSVKEKKVNRVENVGGIDCVRAPKNMKEGSVGGEKCSNTLNKMKNKGSSVTVRRLRTGARIRKTTAIIRVGKKFIPKAQEDGGKKSNRTNNTCGEYKVLEARKGGMKNRSFGFWNENEVMVREAMRRMISRQVSLRDELQSDILWCPPNLGVLKWNTDASLREDDRTAAIGGVLRDWHGSYRCVFSCPVGCVDSNEVELRAIYKALELASCKDWLLSLNMVIESDSMNAVRWCNEDNGGPLNLGYMLSFIRECRMWWPGLEITYMGRKSNSVADRLAKQGHQRTTDFVAWM